MLYNRNRTSLHVDGWRIGAGHLKLYYQAWLPPSHQPIKASVILVHGLGSHGGLFHPLVQQLLAQNYCVYAMDLRGHGRSEGQRGYVGNWSDYREDLRQFVHWVQWQEGSGLGDRPCYLLGHSLGGAIALDYALRFPESLNGLMLTAPALSTQGISPVKLRVGRVMSLLWPGFSLETGFKESQPPTRDARVNQRYGVDPLRHSQATARLSTEFLKTNQRTWEQIDALDLPTLILQGADDVVAPVEVTRQFFGKMPGDNKSLYIYSGGYHEIWNDINRQQVLGDLVAWLNDEVEGLPAEVGLDVELDVDMRQTRSLKLAVG